MKNCRGGRRPARKFTVEMIETAEAIHLRFRVVK
jgi:hypothetical protein